MWRNFADITDDWDYVKNIIGFYGDDKEHFAEVAGPGGWNDPDEVNRVEGWLRHLSPRGKGRYAVGIYNAGSNGRSVIVNKTISDIGLKFQNTSTTFTLSEVFSGVIYGPYRQTDRLVIWLDAYSMKLFIAEPNSAPTKVNRRP